MIMIITTARIITLGKKLVNIITTITVSIVFVPILAIGDPVPRCLISSKKPITALVAFCARTAVTIKLLAFARFSKFSIS